MELQEQEVCDSATSTPDCYRTSLLSVIALYTNLRQRVKIHVVIPFQFWVPEVVAI